MGVEETRTAIETLNARGFWFAWMLSGLFGMAQFWTGAWDDARGTLREALPLERNSVFDGWTRAPLILLEAYAGDRAQVLELLDQFDGPPHATEEAITGRWAFVPAAVEALAVAGEYERAAALAPTMDRCADMMGPVNFVAGVPSTAQGIAAACDERWSDAEDHFRRSLHHAAAVPHRIGEPEARRWFAWMLLRRNERKDRDDARELLREAIKQYGAFGMPKHMELAERMLRGS